METSRRYLRRAYKLKGKGGKQLIRVGHKSLRFPECITDRRFKYLRVSHSPGAGGGGSLPYIRGKKVWRKRVSF